MKTPFVTVNNWKSDQEFLPLFHPMISRIRETTRASIKHAWNEEYFAIKATPQPIDLKFLQEERAGVDTANYVELFDGR